ncbi:phage terminase small subunit [Alloalcanivorax xenomutans]|uniref:phage terminase small subunit n=1 Tax=Alloalcanivorax xenomutans TaxID=1094342 RepID=UPI003BACAC47
MTSPAQAFRQRAEAKKHSANEGLDSVNANAYEKQLLQLNEHRAQLKAIQSTEKKADRKREILPTYLPWINGVLESGSGRQDDVFMTVMVWAIDAAQWDLALTMAAYAIEHSLVMPDQFHRTPGTVIAEEIADAAKRNPESVPLEILQRAMTLTDDVDMHDQVRAKLYKAAGVARTQAGDLQGAERAYTRALELNDSAGCKKDLEKVQAQIKRAQQENSTEQDE